MKQYKIYLSMATLAIVGAMMSSCAEELEVAQPANTDKTVMVKTTVSLGENAATRALTETGLKTFAAGDQIAVIYKNTSNQTVKAVSEALTTADINATDAHNATFSVSLTNPKPGEPVRYIYPASRAVDNVSATTPDNDATINYAALATQDGTFASLASNLDLATFDGNLTESGTLPATASLTNPLTIGKFTIKANNTDITSNITGLTIGDGTNTYAITREAAVGPIYVAMIPVASATISVSATDETTIYAKTFTDKTLAQNYIYTLDLTLSKQLSGTIDLATVTSDIVIADGSTVTGTLGDYYKVSIAAGASVTLNDVTINGANNFSYSWAGITCEGDATIIISGTNTVKGFYSWYPGIQAGPVGTTLTIDGTGSLTATAGDYAAAIGSASDHSSCGNITINGGTINASSGINGAGIGSGYTYSSCGDITIYGGDITASAGTRGTGIGSGYVYGTCGDITINGGTINASSGNYGAGIGSGFDHSSCGNITINGGNITASSGSDGAGIGSGYSYGTCGDITINGGTINASSGSFGAGIGSGHKNSSCDDIKIAGGNITASAGQQGAGIGSGFTSSSCGNITITGGTIIAKSGNPGSNYGNGAGIGSGYDYSSCGDITISGGDITASAGVSGAGIGSGYYGSFSSIVISATITSVKATRGKFTGTNDFASPIGKGRYDQSGASATVTIDETTEWTAGTATTNLNFAVSTTTVDNDTWTLTPKNP